MTSARLAAKPRSSRIEEGPSDAPWSVRCCSPHHPVNRQVEEQRRLRTSLSNTGLHAVAGFAVSHSAREVVVEALDDKDDLLWNSICHEYAP